VSDLSDVLIARLRRIAAGAKVTEAELRTVAAEADGLARSLAAQLDASEQRLTELADEPDSSLAETAAELRRIDRLRPDLEDVRRLLAMVERRAREQRTEWLLNPARDASGPGEAAGALEDNPLPS
jgi:hypothetical protein